MSIFNQIVIDDILKEDCIILQLKDEYGIAVSYIWDGIANYVYKEYYILEVELINSDDPLEEIEYWRILNNIFFEIVNKFHYQKQLVANIVFALSTGYKPIGIPKKFKDNVYKIYKKYTDDSEIFERRQKK